jgi:hypothetical protein
MSNTVESYNPDEYAFAPVRLEDTVGAKEFVDAVIDKHSDNPNHVMEWSSYSSGQLADLIERRQLFGVKSRETKLGQPGILGIVILNEDFAAWQPDNGGFENPIHFSKFSANPELKGFGRQVLWPLMIQFIRGQGYDGLLGEAFPVAGLRQFYRSVGMQDRGQHSYFSPYYKKDIEADRYSMVLQSKT